MSAFWTPAGLRWLLQSHLPPKRPSPGLRAASWGSPRLRATLIPADSHLSRQRPSGDTSCPGIRFSLSALGNCATNLSWWPSFKPSVPTQLLWVSSSPKFLMKRSTAHRLFISLKIGPSTSSQLNIRQPFEMMMPLHLLTKKSPH